MKKLSIKISLVALLFFVFNPFSYADDYSPPMVHQVYFTYDGEPYDKEVKYSIDCYDSQSVKLDKKYWDGPAREYYISASCPGFGCKAVLGNLKFSSIDYCNIIGSTEDGYFLIENTDSSFLFCNSNNESIRSFLSNKEYKTADLVRKCSKEVQIDKCLDDLEETVNQNPDEYYNDYYYSMVKMCNVFFTIPYNSFTPEKLKPSIIINELREEDKIFETINEDTEKIVDNNEVKEESVKVTPDEKSKEALISNISSSDPEKTIEDNDTGTIAIEKDKGSSIADSPSPELEKTTGDDNNGGTSTILEISISENKILYALFIVIIGLLGFIIFRKK